MPKVRYSVHRASRYIIPPETAKDSVSKQHRVVYNKIEPIAVARATGSPFLFVFIYPEKNIQMIKLCLQPLRFRNHLGLAVRNYISS